MLSTHSYSRYCRSGRALLAIAFALATALAGMRVYAAGIAGDLQTGFVSPPSSSRPWVYWFWLNGNITREGITADLEAMQRVGIGGVLIMEVDQGAPVGSVAFMGQKWRELFKHAVSEAHRLGLEVNMNDDAGWNGSGGPWIQPQESMQKVVWSETQVKGSQHFEGVLPQPPTVAGLYRDITVMAFPFTGDYRIENIEVKACYKVGNVGPASDKKLGSDMVIDRARIIDLTSQMNKEGRLVWDAPAGQWIVVRFGHTSTGAVNAPAPQTGRGLECDKLSKEGIEAQFAGMMGRLISDVGRSAGKTLVTTHIDSWENGAQNWTARMREEFQKRRGYDPLPYLPAMMGRVVESLEVSERFLWDLRQTVSDLVVENYAGHMRKLAQAKGVRLSIEAYGGPCDDLPYAGRADEPMCEFWIGRFMYETCKEMASAAHTYGKPILGAEAFTATDSERWLEHPGSIKSLGDSAFCAGVNRFVFHRYAMQPWLDRRPGMTMGPWGLHYERTNTWWNDTLPWHQYLARCQFMLRQGRFVADLCYLQPEESPQGYYPHPTTAYDFDNCSAEVVLTRMSVKDGLLTLPDGLSYRLLVLPNTNRMTPALLRKIRELVREGASIVGVAPNKSPSLSQYPDCDNEIKQLADNLWADCAGRKPCWGSFGHGRIMCGIDPEKVLAGLQIPPDFMSMPHLNYIHRTADGTEIYFVANPEPRYVQALCSFRVAGKRPELWWPETGRIEPAAVFQHYGRESVTDVQLALQPSGSVFVIFRSDLKGDDPIVEVTCDGKSVLSLTPPGRQRIVIEKAQYGVLSDPARTRDVRQKVQRIIDHGAETIHVAQLAEGDDPALNVVKTLIIDYTVDGKALKAKGIDPDNIRLDTASSEEIVELCRDPAGDLIVNAHRAGRYTLRTAGGKNIEVVAPPLPAPLKIDGSWEVGFAAGMGAPERLALDHLISWTEHQDPAVRYFSGAATYRKAVDVPSAFIGKGRRLILDLGRVEVLAALKVNGHDAGLLWKAPYSADVTEFIAPGENAIEIRVVNQWPNRMIGDEQLLEDSDRNANGTLKAWPTWLEQGKPSPTGRYTFTSWRLWKKSDKLLPSGLLGPVQISAVARIYLKQALAEGAGTGH